MHCEQVPQWGVALLVVHVCVQMVDHSNIPPHSASTIDRTTSRFVFQRNPLVTLNGLPDSSENSRANPDSTRGWVVRVALDPTTWREIGRLRLTTPFS